MTNRHDTERESCSHAERIDALLGQMRMLCSQIDQISQAQQKQLDDGELEAFVGSLESRNPKIASLADAGKLIEGLLDGDGAGAGVGAEQIRDARRQLDEMAEMVVNILQRDGLQQKIVEKKRSELSDQLSGVGTAKSAIRAYGGGVQTINPTLQDRKG